MQGTCTSGLAFDAVFLDHLEDILRAIAEKLQQTRTIIAGQGFFDVIRHHPDTRIDQPGISSSAAKADFSGLKHDDPLTCFGQMQGSRQSGVASANDDDIGSDVSR